MITLALETSTPHGSVAVHDGAALLFAERFVSERGHSSLLFPLLQAALKSAPRVEQIAVGLGPGSYAGVRIAIASAMGLELALGVPLVGVPSVAALVRADAPAAAAEYVAIGDARRGTWYWTKVAGGMCVEGPRLLEEAELRARLREHDGPVLATEALDGMGEVRRAVPEAETIAARAARGIGIVARGALEPIYLREPHITQPGRRASGIVP